MSPGSQSGGGEVRSFHIAQRRTADRTRHLNARWMLWLV
jgi:hypothetical protein